MFPIAADAVIRAAFWALARRYNPNIIQIVLKS